MTDNRQLDRCAVSRLQLDDVAHRDIVEVGEALLQEDLSRPREVVAGRDLNVVDGWAIVSGQSAEAGLDRPFANGRNGGRQIGHQAPVSRRNAVDRSGVHDDRRRGVGDLEPQVSHRQLVVGPVVRRAQVLKRAVGADENGDAEGDDDGHGNELPARTPDVPEDLERGARYPHQLISSGAAGVSLTVMEAMRPSLSRTTRSAISPMTEL